MKYDLIVIGGGAAGIFSAIMAKASYPHAKIAVLEKTAVLLSKVRISGGGRCNVTHACFDPKLLIQNYPRGGKELLGPFHRFQPQDTIAWFESKGALLKEEADGRMFPITDSSETIIETLLQEADQLGIEIHIKQKVQKITKTEGGFKVFIQDSPIETTNLILATGSSKEGLLFAKELGHTIEDLVPSLFTFNVPSSPLLSLSGISLPKVTLSLTGSSFEQTGPLLLTHFGFSGPAVLKLSAFAAKFLHERDYRTQLVINWISRENTPLEKLYTLKKESPQKTLLVENPFQLPKNLWKSFLQEDESLQRRFCDIPQKSLSALVNKLQKDLFQIEGKTTHKEEFVTAGGISLKEVDFRTMESKVCSSLFFTGEILDIDGVTGGFNFQNAWTTAFIAGSSIHL